MFDSFWLNYIYCWFQKSNENAANCYICYTAFNLSGGCLGIDIIQKLRNGQRSEFTGWLFGIQKHDIA